MTSEVYFAISRQTIALTVL